MNRYFLPLVFLIACAARAADSPLDSGEFTRDFAKALSETAPTYKVRPARELQVTVTDPKGSEATVFLYDAYAEYRKSPSDKEKIFRKIFLIFVAPQDEVRKVDTSRIVPVIKKRTWLDELRAAAKAKGAQTIPEVVFDDLNEQLIVVYAEDTPNTFRYVAPAQLEEIRLKKEDLRALAATNLKAILPKIEVRPSSLVMVVKADGNYEACLLAVADFWTKERFPVDGEIVVAIPARDHLLVTGSKNTEGLARMREIAARVSQDSPQRLTDMLFVYRDGHFVEFKE